MDEFFCGLLEQARVQGLGFGILSFRELRALAFGGV